MNFVKWSILSFVDKVLQYFENLNLQTIKYSIQGIVIELNKTLLLAFFKSVEA